MTSHEWTLRYSAERFPFHFTGRFIRSQAWPLFRAYEASRKCSTPESASLRDDSRRRRTLLRQARPQHGLAIRPRMAPLLRFLLPTAPHASRVLFSDTAEAVNRTCACLTHDLSAYSVSHALDGFLLARHRRFISPDRHSWDSPLQSFSLSRSRDAFRRSLPSCRYRGGYRSCSPSGPCSTRESVGRRRCFHRENDPDALLGLFPSRAFTLLAVAPPSRSLLSKTAALAARRRPVYG